MPKLYRRLGKVATELNRSSSAIVGFLRSQGYNIDDSPNEKVTNDIYEVLVHEFIDDQIAKDQLLQKKGMSIVDPSQKLIHLIEDDTNFNYKSLFGKYFLGGKRFEIIDPYIRTDVQVTNLIELIKTILSCTVNPTINLTTASDNAARKLLVEQYFRDVSAYLKKEEFCLFTWAFKTAIHDRSIEVDRRWLIVMGRGLDFFKGVQTGSIRNNYRKLKVKGTIITIVDQNDIVVNTSINYRTPQIPPLKVI
ncbi:MAG: Uncharacterized protein JWO06_2869 [Bacteroidota bacterium]|nr:Uncharacterized protein [Bacteroidota bacterium]